MNSKTIKKYASDRKYLRQENCDCLVCKTHAKNSLAYNPIEKIGNREIATQLIKCNKCQKINEPF